MILTKIGNIAFNSKEFDNISSELGKLILKGDIKGIDKIKWDVVSGTKSDEKEE
ncbi:unnamed protein product [marine sediment metagenome]|uniref:Uncharacterized protein n=1 Tax=marine sediment metagenome TaxID=412755 RepID=X1E4F6_9ZZZZ